MKVCWVALIGRPNVGKSTLMNHIIKYDLSIVSPVAQTTRDQISGVYTDDQYQIIFVDTPGIHKPNSKFGLHLNQAAWDSLKEVDLVLFLSPINQAISTGDQLIIAKLERLKNKIAVITKDDLATTPNDLQIRITELKQLGFSAITTVNYQNPAKIDELLEQIKSFAYEDHQYFDADYITDRTELFLTKEVIRNSAIKFLNEELPHSIFVEINNYQTNPGKLHVEAIIYCKKESQKGIIIGKGGTMIKQIGSDARRAIMQKFRLNVDLRLQVKVEKNWINDPQKLKKIRY